MKRFSNLKFRTSSFSNVDPVPFCVSVAQTSEGNVAVKHSQDHDFKNVLEFTEEEWNAFLKGVKAGEFDF